MDQIVKQVLEVDCLHRDKNKCPDEDLFVFSDLKPNEWDYSLPTLASGNSNKLVHSLQEFIKTFYEHIPFKIPMVNILIAGGAISSILTKNNPNDIDMFVYGLTPDEATIRVRELITDLSEAYDLYLIEKNRDHRDKQDKPYKPHGEFKFIRNKNCITLIFEEKYTIQIILRIYENISQILHGFDLGSSAVGFDGTNVYFTSLSKFAYEYSCNILDTTRRSTTYEHRLIKYHNRNFDIIVPYLDITKLRNINSKYKLDDVCELPYMVFSYSGINGNKISVSRFLVPNESSYSDYQINDLDEYKIFYINLHNMVWDKPDFYFYIEDVKDKIDVLLTKPLLSRRRVIDYYDELMKKLNKNGSINIKMLKKYVKDTKEILRILVEKGDNDSQFNLLLEQAIQAEKIRILNIADRLLSQSYPLHWITTNPGTQITSSFNPIIEDVHKWYGDYYTVNPQAQLPLVRDTDEDSERDERDEGDEGNKRDEGNESDDDESDESDECD
jgi:hypothetical protein